MKQEYPALQGLMDVAYDRWNENKSWGKTAFRKQLKPVEKFAVSVGNMNYQVGNGGWSQWYFNGYAEEANNYLIDQLPKTGPAGKVVTQMLVEISRIQENWEPEVEAFIEDSYWDEDTEEPVDCSYYEWQPNDEEPDIERFDNLYYDLNSALMAEVEAVLQKPYDEIIALLNSETPIPVPVELLAVTSERPVLHSPIDGNIYAVMAGAGRILRRAGKRDEAKKMLERVTSSESYPQALGIVQEYVEIQV